MRFAPLILAAAGVLVFPFGAVNAAERVDIRAAATTRSPEASRELAETLQREILSGGDVYQALDHEVGASLVYELPQFDFHDQVDLQIVESMTRYLPADFAESLRKAHGDPNGEAMLKVKGDIESAYTQAAQELLPLARQKVAAVLNLLAHGQLDEANYNFYRNYFEKLGTFGPGIRALSKKFSIAVEAVKTSQNAEERRNALAYALRGADEILHLDLAAHAETAAQDEAAQWGNANEREKKEIALAASVQRRLPESPVRDALLAEVRRQYSRASGLAPAHAPEHQPEMVIENREPPLALPEPPNPKILAGMVGRPVRPGQVAGIIAAALAKARPDLKLEVVNGFNEVRVLDHTNKRMVFYSPLAPRAGEAHLQIQFALPELDYFQRIDFLRGVLLPYGIPVEAMGFQHFPFSFRLGTTVLTPKRARQLAAN